MTEFVIDFLPADARRRGLAATSRRRTALLVTLLGCSVAGVAAHSWNRFREAESRRSVSLALTTNTARIDDVMDRLAAEQGELRRYLSVHERLALPIEPSDLIATVTHLMPERTSLSHLRLEVKEQAAAPAQQDGKQPTKPRPQQAKADAAAPAPAAAPARWIDVSIRGYAAGNGDLYEFERKLSNTAPFGAVTVSENRQIEVPGARLQEFAITCRIDLAGASPAAPAAPAPTAVASRTRAQEAGR